MSLISGGNHSCKSTGPVRVIIGDASSTQTIMLSRTLIPLQVPLVSFIMVELQTIKITIMDVLTAS